MAKKGQKFQKYSYELKKQVVQDYLDGASKTELKEKHSIVNNSQIESWMRAYRKHGLDGLRPKKKGRPKKRAEQSELEQLRMENEILKKIQSLLEQEKP